MAGAAAWSLAVLGFLTAYPETILSAASFFVLFYFVYLRRSHLPVNWPLVGMFPTVLIHFHHLHDFVAGILAQSGSTTSLYAPGMSLLLTCDPDNVYHILTTNFDNYPKGEEFYEVFDIFGNSLFGVDGDSWKFQRKIANTYIGDRSFRAFVVGTTREKAEKGLLPLLLHKCEAAGESADLQDLFTRLAFDVTCRMVFGDDPGSLSIDLPEMPFSTAFDDAWEALLLRHVVPKFAWKMMRWLDVGMERKMTRAREVIDGTVYQRIKKKREERAKIENDYQNTAAAAAAPVAPKDLLMSYIDKVIENNFAFGDKPDKFLRDTVVFLMVAGRDAFSISLSWLFWLLSKNREAEAKILEELALHRSSENTSASFGADELNKMLYLHGAVCEALRLFPPVPFEEKNAVAADVLPSGAKVEAGRKILLCVYAMGRSESIWGKDYMEFKPERWITEDGTRLKQVPAYKFMAFNSGPRLCPGREIGLMQVKTVAAAVLWNFEMEVLEEPVPKNAGMLRMKNGMMVNIRRRKTGSFYN
ncbi:hypothetical protein Cni_G05608 [Canna indica]|uniref:Cytochrome P450 n=1 Tax=Canna indica TaxID=4628 RepID=A0AAQ3Q3D7_9LILI|nr:hypothetical protein Cni_G05608 [Canna indica]